jgi:hypothetical protein
MGPNRIGWRLALSMGPNRIGWRLALSKGPNRIGVLLPLHSSEDGRRANFRNVVILIF